MKESFDNLGKQVKVTKMDAVEVQKLENRYSSIVERILRYHPEPDLAALRKAFDFALVMHTGQYRKSGEPYLSHPLEVLDIVAELKLDTDSLVAALLHDVVEDTETTIEELAEMFGENVAFLVNGVTKLSKVPYKSREEAQAENVRKMLFAMSEDLRVILVKLADRLHNMRTLKHMPPEKQQRIATETMEIYAPLANRLGISWMKSELEDLSFQYLYPEDYYWIAERISQRKRERESFIREVIQVLRAVMEENGIDADISGRPKHFWSIFLKMKRGETSFDQIYDMLAFRIIVDEVKDCYNAFGIVHNLWKPIPGRWKDYIGNPKENGYRSLHTSVIGPNSQRIEVQIRTKEMHAIAEKGIAAHWRYKEGRAVPNKDDVRFDWLHRLMEEHSDSGDPVEFLNLVRKNPFQTDVYVNTPQGDVKVLPQGATILDFAYAVHTEVGNRCTGAMVDNRIVPLSYQLQTYETCEIQTSKSQRPRKDWLDLVITSRARNKIRNALREEDRIRSRELGQELFEKELKRRGSAYTTIQKNGKLARYLDTSRYQNEHELFIDIGYGKANCTNIVEKIIPSEEEPANIVPVRQVANSVRNMLRKIRPGEKPALMVDGVDNMMYNFAKCCNPVPGEEIVGFVTRGRGLSIHAKECDKIAHLDPARFLYPTWQGVSDECRFKVKLTIHSTDETGMLAKITKALADSNANIVSAQSALDETDNRFAKHTYELHVRNAEHIKHVIKRLKRIKGVTEIKRESLE